MTPAEFERQHQAEWAALEAQLQALSLDRGLLRRRRGGAGGSVLDAAQLAALYRRACEHLALARSRAYPISRILALESLTRRAHQALYRSQGDWQTGLRRLLLDQVPQTARRQRHLIALSLLAFAGPLLAMGLACWRWPTLVLTVMDAAQVTQYAQMYAPDQHTNLRHADSDVMMFGYYIGHNIGIAFQCFASGLLAGVGALYYLVFNGALIGAVAGYLSAVGHGPQFWPFVATHGAYELTAIVLSGACGLRLGQALLLPGRTPRTAALLEAGQAVLPLMVASIGLLLVAAAVEAFWSSAAWVEPGVKYAAGALSWILVLAWLAGRLRGRGREAPDAQ